MSKNRIFKKIYFLSTDAIWQRYRWEVLTTLADRYDYKIEILTSGELSDYLFDTPNLKYRLFDSWLPDRLKVKFYPKALWYIYKNRPDYILSMSNVSGITEFISLLESKILKIPFVFWTHGYDHHYRADTLANRFREKYILFFLKKADHIITFSQKGKEYLTQKDIAKEKITIAPNTLNTERWVERAKSIDREIERKKYGYSRSDTVLLFSGRLYEEKRLMSILEMMKRIQQEYDELSIYLHVIGDGEEYLSATSFVERENIKNTLFHGSIFDEERVSEIFLVADIFVMPSSIGLAIIHAFCFALPMITEESTSHGPEIQYLKEGENGYMLKKDDEQGWVEIVLKLHHDRDLLDRLSKASFEVIEGEGSIANMTYQISRIFDEEL